MGLSNERAGGTVVYASKGKFQVKRPDGGYDEFLFLRGILRGIQFSDRKGYEGKEFRQLLLHFSDGDSSMSLSLDSNFGYAHAIKAKLASISDFTSPLELSLTYDPATKTAGAFVNQLGVSHKQAWTKGHLLDGMPEWKFLGQQKGKDVWDSSDQERWIEEYLLREIVPKLPKISTTATPSQSHGGLSDHHDEPHEEHHEEDGSGVPADSDATPF